MSEIAVETGRCNRSRYGWVIQLLLIVKFIPPGIPPGMVVPKVVVIFSNGTNDIPFHDLHVIDVIQELEVVGAYLLHQFNTPGRIVAHVVRMIDSAIQQFHMKKYVLLLCYPHYFLGSSGNFVA